jgi:hypothetical protein
MTFRVSLQINPKAVPQGRVWRHTAPTALAGTYPKSMRIPSLQSIQLAELLIADLGRMGGGCARRLRAALLWHELPSNSCHNVEGNDD